MYIFALDATGVVGFRMKRLRVKGPLLRVVVFHDIKDDAWFDSVIRSFTEHYHVLTPKDFYEEKYAQDRLNVLITFDDGYHSWVSKVLPVLSRYGATGLFFINSGLLDVAKDEHASAVFMRERLRLSPKRALSWDGARRLLHEGHAFGGHTVSHAYLSSCTPEEVRTEIEKDKKKIETELSITLHDFAYPFGTRASISTVATEAVKRVGFERGFTAVSDFVSSTNIDHFMIPRMCIEKRQSIPSIHRWMRGGFDIFTKIKHSV